MPNPSSLSTEELEYARDLGAATYLSAYIHLMSRALKVDSSNHIEVNLMAAQMVEPLNHAVEACWRGMMNDRSGMFEAMVRFRKAVEAFQ